MLCHIRTKVWKINSGLAELRLSWQNLCALHFKLRHATESGTLLYKPSTMNVDCGLHINPMHGNPILTHPSLRETTNPPSSPDRPCLTSHFDLCLLSKISKFIYQCIYVHYVTITSLPVYNYMVLVIPLMKILRPKTFRPLTWSSLLCYVYTQW